MKSLLVGCLLVNSFAVQASVFSCEATLTTILGTEMAQLESVSGNAMEVKIKNFNFLVSLPSEELILASISYIGDEGKLEVSSAITDVPDDGEMVAHAWDTREASAKIICKKKSGH